MGSGAADHFGFPVDRDFHSGKTGAASDYSYTVNLSSCEAQFLQKYSVNTAWVVCVRG